MSLTPPFGAPEPLPNPLQPIGIPSADAFRALRAPLEIAAENIRLARLAGALHLIAELIEREPMISGVAIAGSRQTSSQTTVGQIGLLARASNGFEIPILSAARAFAKNGIDFKGYEEARAYFPPETRPELARLQRLAQDIWAPALDILTHAEIEAALGSPATTFDPSFARGPGAADLARHWGFDWLAAEIERMQLGELAPRPAASNPESDNDPHPKKRL